MRAFIGIAITNGPEQGSYKPDLKNVQAKAFLMYGDILLTGVQK